MVLTASSATLAGGDEHTSFTSAIFHIITFLDVYFWVHITNVL